MQKYKLTYDWQDIAEVEIDETKASSLMKDMLLFWTNGEDRIEENDGNITKAWLKMLGGFIARNRRIPDGDEGWTKLDGTHGIKILSWDRWELDEDQIEVESI